MFFLCLHIFWHYLSIPTTLSIGRVIHTPFASVLAPNFRKNYDEIHDKAMPDKLKEKYYEERFLEFMRLLEEYNLNDKLVDEAVKETPLIFRDNAKDFFANMYELNIPIIIISCSIKNIIEKVLKMHDCYYDNIEIYANYYDYSIYRNHICSVTPYNKNKVEYSNNMKDLMKNREYVLLIGDQIQDISMVSKDKLKNTITFGFLDKDIEKNLEKYNNCFDVVLTENSSFEDVMNLLKI